MNGDLLNYSIEKRIRRKDGTYIWVMLSVAGVPKPTGGFDYTVAIVQDINERKKMEEELRMHRDHLEKLVEERTKEINQEIAMRKEKEEQYLALVESVVEWVWETDENFVHTYISPRVSEYLGYETEDFLGKTPYQFMTAEAVPVVKKIINRRKPFGPIEVPALHKDGRIVFIEGNGRPFYDKDGVFKGYRGSCRDTTEQKRTMDILKDNERQLMTQSETLKETNAALRVLLKQREDDKREMEDIFVSNIKEMILPYVQKMQKDKIEMRHKAYLDIIAANLNEIMAPFLNRIRQLNFTPKEIEVASLIRDGKTTKEIAEIMGVATSAIDSHRNNIRAKLGLINKDVNLRSFLMTFK
jgi:PAS domain S-box-containing protein